ncbi:THO complex subunit [Brachionus plicatilis]|uniref:THO complex subunit n=1 Tax=Brachionus plicatilis TaxID=10195 RepID=A0A3M7PR53_BRAPC|nr:THO complex subunit [Brachionus plicatilis]
MTSAEDDIIKKRLLIEGDSGNEDRIINKLIKNFVKWTNSFYAENGILNEEENSENLYEQLVSSLGHAEFGLIRNQFIVEMNKNEQENYKMLYEKISNEIEKAKKKIIENKAELVEARKIRKNRQEYDVLAKQILNYPDRREMQETIKNLEAKVESLKKAECDYDRKIDLRRKQFSVVLQSLSSLKNLIESDTNIDEYLNQIEMHDDAHMSKSRIKKDQSPETNEEMDEDTKQETHTKRDKYSIPEVEMEES